MQSAALFPLNGLNLLSNGQIYFRIVLEIVAGVATFFLLRRLIGRTWLSVVGGIAFALNGTFSWMFHAPGNPIAFAPLLLLGIEIARDSSLQGRWRGLALIAVSLALSLYAGFPEVAFIDGLLGGVWFIARGIGLPRRALVIYGRNVAVGVVTSLLIAAPILVAFADYLPHANIGGHGSAFAHAVSNPATALPALFVPYLFGPIFGFFTYDHTNQLLLFWSNVGGYFAASLCALALISLAGRQFRALRLLLAAWILLGIGRLVGVSWALTLVNLIPGVKSTAFYRYAPASWELAIVVLAVLGLDDILKRTVSRVVILLGGLLMLLALLLAYLTARPVLHNLTGAPHNRAWSWASLAWAAFVIVVIVAIAMYRARPFARGLLSTVVVLDVAAMFIVPQFSAPQSARLDTRPVTFLAKHLSNGRFFTLGPLAPNYGSYFGLGSAAINDVPIPKSYAAYIDANLDSNVDPLVFTGTTVTDPRGPSPADEFVRHLSSYAAVGVKYVVVPQGLVLPPSWRDAGLRQVFHDPLAQIFQVPNPAPLFGSDDGACRVRVESQTVAVVDCQRSARIVYREQYMPGWRATANGRALQVKSHGPVFQRVQVAEGRSTLRFSFLPPHSLEAAVALVLGVGVLVAFQLPWARSRREPPFEAKVSSADVDA